jgi:acyl-[acyl-carrier-protein] desaturase
MMERAEVMPVPCGAVRDHLEVVRAIEATVADNLALLAPLERAWQPSDYLPDMGSDHWQEEVAAFRRTAEAVSDELLVALVGGMVTEEALPLYSVSLNGLVGDDEGTSAAPWARWLRGWTAEENRHGDVLNAYLRLTGRVNMRAVERTVHALIAGGFNPKSRADPYRLLVYTSFQERATCVAHGNLGRLAGAAGESNLARICGTIAGDEARHGTFYARMMDAVLDHDPAGGILAVRAMLRGLIAMPGRLMEDGGDPDLFGRFAAVAQRAHVYTAHDYASIVGHLVETWNIGRRAVTGTAARAQDELCRQADRCERLADRLSASVDERAPMAFSWIHNRRI